MVESFVLIKDNYRKVYERYIDITGSEADSDNDEGIICDDMKFENENGWCLITLLYEEDFAEEILAEISDGKELMYFYSDDVQMDCEFLVMNKNEVIRKKYIYSDTPELNEDEGHLKCEGDREFKDPNDIDYLIKIAKSTPEKMFEDKIYL